MDVSKRDPAIDILKAAAIFAVVVIHTAAAGFLQLPLGSAGWFSAVLWGSLARFAVPVFFMCSGAMLLDPERALTLKKLWTKNLPRIAAALFFWAGLYALFELMMTGNMTGPTLVQAAKDLLLFRHHFHLYFLHILLLVYLLLPVTRVITKHASKKELRYLLAAWLLLGILYPTLRGFYPLNLLAGIPAQYGLNMTYAAVGYGMAGYFIKKYPMGRPWMWGLLFLAGLAITLGATAGLSLSSGRPESAFWEGMSPGVCLMSLGLFGFVYRRARSCPPAIYRLSLASFGIYLTHDFFNILLRNFGVTCLSFPAIASIPVLSLGVLAAAAAAYWILSKIPWVNRYLI